MLASPLSAEVLSGPIRVIDADTLDIGGPANIRLIGIDAAEGDQPCRDGAGRGHACGQIATDATRRLYEGRAADCRVQAYDRYDRALAVCFVDGVDVNADLVRRGLARTYRGGPAYAAQEREARRAGRGLWAYDMLDPAQWRARQRQARAADFAPDGTCGIKGNISDNGRIYHVPGGRHYDRTRISESRGERWFCSESEARAAGWRRARS